MDTRVVWVRWLGADGSFVISVGFWAQGRGDGMLDALTKLGSDIGRGIWVHWEVVAQLAPRIHARSSVDIYGRPIKYKPHGVLPS